MLYVIKTINGPKSMTPEQYRAYRLAKEAINKITELLQGEEDEAVKKEIIAVCNVQTNY